MADPDSDFEIEVAERLRARGYSIEPQVGVSGFKIDLGVRHPDDASRFIVGIECDGAKYHSSKSARDWFDNPDFQTDRLIKEIARYRDRPTPPYRDYVIGQSNSS